MLRFFSLLLLAVLPVLAAETFPKPDWKDAPNPLASPDAVPGGTLVFAASQPPKSLNSYLDNNSFAAQIFGSLYDSLLGSDPLTADFVPGIATRWTISDDKRIFTFELNPAAKWSDGRPVTAADVKWTFDKLMDPASLTDRKSVV